MDSVTYESALTLAQAVIFGERVPNVADALVLLNWLDDNKPVRINRHKKRVFDVVLLFSVQYNSPGG